MFSRHALIIGFFALISTADKVLASLSGEYEYTELLEHQKSTWVTGTAFQFDPDKYTKENPYTLFFQQEACVSLYMKKDGNVKAKRVQNRWPVQRVMVSSFLDGQEMVYKVNRENSPGMYSNWHQTWVSVAQVKRLANGEWPKLRVQGVWAKSQDNPDHDPMWAIVNFTGDNSSKSQAVGSSGSTR